jgi:hypothetical protein
MRRDYSDTMTGVGAVFDRERRRGGPITYGL